MGHAESFPVPGNTRLRKHCHETGHICVVLDGGFVERDKSSWRDVGAGTVRVSGAARHDIDFGESGATCLVLEFDAPIELPPSARFFDRDDGLMRIARSIHVATRSRDPSSRIHTEDLTTEFLAQVSRRLNGKAGSPPPWLERVRELIHDSSGNASVETLADEAGVHRVHLARTFRDHYGVAVTRYARSVRVQSALALLSNNSFTLSRVAIESGFADQSHLTREIRAATGATPGTIRTMLHPFKTAHG